MIFGFAEGLFLHLLWMNPLRKQRIFHGEDWLGAR